MDAIHLAFLELHHQKNICANKKEWGISSSRAGGLVECSEGEGGGGGKPRPGCNHQFLCKKYIHSGSSNHLLHQFLKLAAKKKQDEIPGFVVLHLSHNNTIIFNLLLCIVHLL